jgi:hypothetical protein
MVGVLAAVLGFVYVVAAVVVLYRVVGPWLTTGAEVEPLHLIANAFNAIVLFAALAILHAVAASYGVVPPLKLP